MGTKEKLIDRFMRQPSDFTWNEMRRFLGFFGYEEGNKGKTSGSRVEFTCKGKIPIILHKPHPGNIVKEYTMRDVLNKLTIFGLLK